MTTEKQAFLSYLQETSKRVDQWPEWKKSSSNSTSPARLAANSMMTIKVVKPQSR
nr:hypothetical protein [uncultured Moellerella sp.]